MSADEPKILEARIPKSDVPKVYRRLAPHYDAWARRAETKARNRCLELACIRDGEAVLEVAVGTGLTFVEILKKNPHGRNEGIDITEEMLTRARQRAAEIGVSGYRLRVGDAYQLEHPDATFDVLVNNYMFDLLPVGDFPHVLGEFRRVLKRGGRLVMVNMTRGERWYHGLWELVYRMRPAWLGGCRGVQLVPFLEAAGFTVESREYVTELGFASEVIRAIKT
jgi:demethylmenaquinone methyltransferase / 2-methoxy-6-polyprenyl-1,4-benzoquinol methylase